MANSIKHLEEINATARQALKEMKGTDQGAFINLLFVFILKISKISHSVKLLYPMLENDRTIEFSIGILMRTMLMDAMLFLKLRTFFEDNKGHIEFENLKNELNKITREIYAQDVNYLIKDVERSNQLTPTELKEFSETLVEHYTDYFVWESNSLKFIKGKVNNELKPIYTESKKHRFYERESLFALYMKYCKYDHASNFMIKFETLPNEELIDGVDAAIVHMRIHLMNVIGYAYDFGNNLENLLPLHDNLRYKSQYF